MGSETLVRSFERKTSQYRVKESKSHVNCMRWRAAMNQHGHDIGEINDAALACVNNWGEYAAEDYFGGWDRTYQVERTHIRIVVADDLTEPTPLLIIENEVPVLSISDIDIPEYSVLIFEAGAWIQRLMEEVEDLR